VDDRSRYTLSQFSADAQVAVGLSSTLVDRLANDAPRQQELRRALEVVASLAAKSYPTVFPSAHQSLIDDIQCRLEVGIGGIQIHTHLKALSKASLGGGVQFDWVKVVSTPAFHSSDSACPLGTIVKASDGTTVYHAGDTCLFGDMALYAKLYPMDVALLPIGGVFTMDADQARAFIKDHKQGSFTLLDVRQPGEYENTRIPGAKLIPLPELPNRLHELDPEKPVIAY